MTMQHNMKREIKIFYELFSLFIYYIMYISKFLWSKWECMYFEDNKICIYNTFQVEDQD